MGRAKDPRALKRLHKLLRQPQPPFRLGMNSEEGRQKRALWLDILKELRRVQRFVAGSVQHPPEEERLLKDVRACIVDAALFLMHGHEVLGDEDTTQQIRVWSSPQNARLAIIQEAIALAHSRKDAPLVHNKPPLIILISERLHPPSLSKDDHHDSHEVQQETLRRNFLDSWSSASYGVGEVLTILTDSVEKARESVQQVFDGMQQSDMFPVLMVIHASHDSNITSDMATIKRICESWNVRLCVEGPALAMLAQSSRPSDPDECANSADVMLLDPASWFGFRMCAVATWHKLCKGPVLREFKDHYSRLLLNQDLFKDHDETHGLATAPVLNLWTVLSRIGLKNIRSYIDAATILAESFIVNLRDSPNIVTAYAGVGCIVRISYALSREDRLLPKEISQEHVSLVNNIIYASLREESQALCVQQHIAADNTSLQFSPVRLLSSGTLWSPSAEMVEEYAKKVQDTVDKYESCRAGSVAFRSCVAKCREIQFVEDVEDQPELRLSFGAFRIVPIEMAQTWIQSEHSADIVEGLTRLVAKELTETPHDISVPKYVAQQDTNTARVLAEQFSQKNRPFGHNFVSRALHRRWSFPHGYGGGGLLPFDVFLHSDSKESFHDFVSIEPRLKCKPIDAVHQAAIASDLMIACVAKVMGLWRAGEVTLPIEENFRNNDISDSIEVLDYIEELPGEEQTLENELSHCVSDSEDVYGSQGVHESEVNSAVRSSSDESDATAAREHEVDQDDVKTDSPTSPVSRDFGNETMESPQTIFNDEVGSVKQTRENGDFRMKNFLSVSTIGKSLGGTGTDEESVPPDYILPTGARSLCQASAEGPSKPGEPLSTVEALPMIKTTNEGSWFGPWGTRRSNNQQRENDDEDDSSDSSEESSGGDGYSSGNEGNSSDEDDDEDSQDSDSSSFEGSRDERGSSDERDETSEDIDGDDERENEDSTCESSSSGSDHNPKYTDVKTARPNTFRQTRTSRLLSWIRGSNTQCSVPNQEQKDKNQSSEGSDSEVTSTSSHNDMAEGRTHRGISSSDGDSESYLRRCQAPSVGQYVESGSSEESEEGTITRTESSGSESESDDQDESKVKMAQRTGGDPTVQSRGFRWFGWAGEPAKYASTRSRRRSTQEESDSDSSEERENASQRSNITEKTSRESSGRTRLGYESSENSLSNEEVGRTDESSKHSSDDETSQSSVSVKESKQRERRRRSDTDSSANESSSTSDDSRNSNARNEDGRSFFDWVLPAWATTPPKWRKPGAPAPTGNSRLWDSASSESSIDTESDGDYRRDRRAVKRGRQAPTARGKWAERTVSSPSGNRYRGDRR